MQDRKALGGWTTLWHKLQEVQSQDPQLQYATVHTSLSSPFGNMSGEIHPLLLSCEALYFLPSLSALRELSIGRFQGAGPGSLAPLSQLSALSSLPSLTKLVLTEAEKCPDLVPVLQTLPRLQELQLELTSRHVAAAAAAAPVAAAAAAVPSGVGNAIAAMRGLVHLSITGGVDGMLQGLSGLTKLTHLTWRSHADEDGLNLPQEVSTLVNLVDFSYSANNAALSMMQSVLTPLAKLRRLELALPGQREIFNTNLLHTLQNLPCLGYLGIARGGTHGAVAGASISGLAAFTKLTGLQLSSIDLSRPEASMPVMCVLTSLTGLKELSLRSCSLRDVHLATISARLQQLTSLDLYSNRDVSSAALSMVTQLRNLAQLDLRDTQGSDWRCQLELPVHLRQFSAEEPRAYYGYEHEEFW